MSTTASGRPVRFFVLLMGGWATIRIASGMLGSAAPVAIPLPQADPPAPGRHAQGQRFAQTAAAAPVLEVASPTSATGSDHLSAPRLWAHAVMIPRRVVRPGSTTAIPAGTPDLVRADLAMTASPAPNRAVAAAAAVTTTAAQDMPAAVPLAPATHPRSDRWRGSAWLLWRDGSATSANAVTAGRLGGSQAGLRLDYDLTPHAPGRIAAYGRVSTALNRPASPEGAIGLAWQPVRTVPVSLAAERRIALGKGARNANALMAVGGFGPTPVALGLEAEAYAQGGMVGFRSRDLFMDGKFSLLSPIAGSPLRLGASVSGGAQPQVERLDIGPELQVRLPLPHISTRLSVEWRERIAGHAAPASGLAVTLGADF